MQALLHSSHMYWESKKSFEKHGVMVSDVRIDVDKMLGQKNEVVKGLTSGIEGLFKKNKVRHQNADRSLLTNQVYMRPMFH